MFLLTADAKKAVSEMNGVEIAGCKLKVAVSTSDKGDSDACHACGMMGHIAKYCPLDKKDSCHRCGLSGHWAKDCPNRHGMFIVTGDFIEIWVVPWNMVIQT